MEPVTLSLIAFACVLAGILLGALLPGDKLSSDAKEVIRLSTGLIATIAALVLGLLIASAKSSYDTQTGQIRQLTANIVLLDLMLSEYGPEALDARRVIRAQTQDMVKQIWAPKARSAREAFQPTPEGLAVYEKTQALTPSNDAQRTLKARAIQLISDSAQTRLLLFAHGKDPIPLPFLAILIFWLTLIFASFSLFTHPGPFAVLTMTVFALSATGAIYLILELGQPFAGLLMIPSEQVSHALAPL